MKKGLLAGLGALLLPPLLATAQEPPLLSVGMTAPPPVMVDQADAGWGKGMAVAGMGSEAPQLPCVWTNAEFLLWWTKGVPVTSPLLTQANQLATSTVPGGAGSLTSPNTTVLLGDQTYGLGTRYGGRFTAGAWLDADKLMGVEGSYFFLGPTSSTTMFGSNGTPGSPILGIPWQNANVSNPAQFEQFFRITVPGVTTGGAFLTLNNSLQGGELNTLGRLLSSDTMTITGLVGARYLYFQEKLDFGAGNEGLSPGTLARHFFSFNDSFQGVNNFYGGQLGLRGEWCFGDLFVSMSTKCAVGEVSQVVNISGASVGLPPPTPAVAFPLGFFAVQSNSGQHHQTEFAVVPECICNVGYCLCKNVRATVGYTFLYINNVARPGTMIETELNPRQVPWLAGSSAGNPPLGVQVPGYSFNRTDFWAQGVQFGLQIAF